MNDWKLSKLENYVDLLTGFPFKSEFFTDEIDDIPLVKGDNLQQKFIEWNSAKRWRKDDLSKLKIYQLQVNDVVLAMDRPWVDAGLKYAWIKKNDPQCLLVQRISRLRGINGLNTNYLRYIIGSPEFSGYIKNIVTGVNVPHISPKQILSFNFVLPPLQFQTKIATILSSYDELIENNKQRIKLLEEMAEEIYKEWFVRMRFPGYETTKFFDEQGVEVKRGTEEGLPEGWEYPQLKNHITIFRGKSYSSEELRDDDGLPMLNLKNVNRGGGFRRDGLKYFEGKHSITNLAYAGDIILAVTDMTQNREIIGRVARVPEMNLDKFIISMDLVKVVPLSLSRTFIYSFFKYSDIGLKLAEFANGVNVLHLKPDLIYEERLILPDNELVNKYDVIVNPMLDEIDVLENKNQLLQQTRDLLLPRLISGKLSVEHLLHLENEVLMAAEPKSEYQVK
jgi:type I restriction enzyme S subunit